MAYRKKRKTTRFGHGLMFALGTFLILILLLSGLALYCGWRISESDQNLPNIVLDDVAVGGLNHDETVQKLKQTGWDRMNDIPLEIQFPLNLNLKLDRLAAGAALTADQAADILYSFGHGSNLFDNLEQYIRAVLHPSSVVFTTVKESPRKLSGSLNETYIRANIRSITDRFKEMTSDPSLHLEVEKSQMSMIKGGGSISLDDEKIYLAIEDAFLENRDSIVWNEIEGDVQLPDFEQVYTQVSSETADAYFSSDRHEIISETLGCSFGVEEAVELWEAASPGDTVIIPVKLNSPFITADLLRSLMYRDRLCFMTTSFWGSSANRINNIDLAAKKLDGLEIWPGETFSYNEVVGQRTEEAGFLMAGAYADGEVIEEIGGGICQVSSTLYCAAMYAQMTTVQRQNHYFPVSYLSMGYDATVSWTWPDYRFRNDLDFPVKLVAFVDDHSITIEFWGTNLDGSHVSPYTNTWEVYDQEYPSVLIGYGATTFCRILDANDNVIRTVEEPTGIYHLHDEEILWPPEKLAKDATAASITLGLN